LAHCGPASTANYEGDDESESDFGDTSGENSVTSPEKGRVETTKKGSEYDEVVEATEFPQRPANARRGGRLSSFRLREPDSQFFASRRTFSELQETQMPETEEERLGY